MKTKKLLLCFWVVTALPVFGQHSENVVTKENRTDENRLVMQYSDQYLKEKQEQNTFKLEQDKMVLNHLNNNVQFRLMSVDVDRQKLNTNKSQLSQVLESISQEFSQGLILSESDNELLIVSEKDANKVYVFGQKSILENGNILVSPKHSCATCAKSVELSRAEKDGTIVIAIQDEDESNSDIVYLFTFKK
jgi:hypothetical protein